MALTNGLKRASMKELVLMHITDTISVGYRRVRLFTDCLFPSGIAVMVEHIIT